MKRHENKRKLKTFKVIKKEIGIFSYFIQAQSLKEQTLLCTSSKVEQLKTRPSL